MTCDCAEFAPNIQLVDAPRLFASARQAHDGSWDYRGVPFRFCPWCGKRLVEESVGAALKAVAP